MEFDFLKPAKYFFAISAVTMLASLVMLLYPGPRYGIEFTGGTRMVITVPADRTTEDVTNAYKTFEGAELSPTVNKLDSGNYLARIRGIDDETHKSLVTHLGATLGDVTEVQYTTIGPTVGATLKVRALTALAVASAGIILYIAFAFRKVPKKYSPWKFGIAAVVTLFHDVLVTVGVFVILSYTTDFEVDTLFVTALLTILGYSVNDTIIIFDRIRDNLFIQERKEDFAAIANRSVNQTWKRSLYTSGSTIIMLSALFLLGSASIKWFVLALLIGISLGTYSSIFVATPLLVLWNKKKW